MIPLRWIFVTLVIVVVMTCIYYNSLTNKKEEQFQLNFNPGRKGTSKLILVFTPFFKKEPWPFLSDKYADFGKHCGCDFSGCDLTYNKDKFLISDAVIFHGWNVPKLPILKYLHMHKPKFQRWYYFMLENPFYTPPTRKIADYFDYSISYRINADVRAAYGGYRKLKKRRKIPANFSLAVKKTKQIAWLVSNCSNKNKRDLLIDALAKEDVRTHVGGECSQHYKNKIKCSTDQQCLKQLQQFKFYYAAENKLCMDYVTEKYWKWALHSNAIPIVLGGANYSGIAVPGSYINPLDFHNVTELARFIKRVDADDELFESFFKWREKYTVFTPKNGCSDFSCALCQQLKSPVRRKKKIKYFPNRALVERECIIHENNFLKWLVKNDKN